MSKATAALLLTAGLAAAQGFRISDILTSQHNLSASGPGPITSPETRACIFCHIPHKGYTDTAYLWNHPKSQAGYTPYQSPTLNAAPGIPSIGTSQLCLSCHDGTVALSQTVASGSLSVSGSLAPNDRTGTDFSGHHPVGIRPVDDGQIYTGLAQNPARAADPAVRLPGNNIECISCHEPHVENRDTTRTRFLVRSNLNGALCLACHDPSRGAPNLLNGWSGAAHQTAAHTIDEYYGAVGSNACLSCHQPHHAPALPLLRASEEAACAVCHSGSGTSPILPNVMSEFNLAYAHPVLVNSGLHAPGENAYPLNANRHAECPDCHNPHAALPPSVATPPTLRSAMSGATGVDAASGILAQKPAANEYEVCFKCHANSSSKPQVSAGYASYGRNARRQADTVATDPYNTRLEFSSLVARHDVIFPRQRTDAQVPSLRPFLLDLNGSASSRSLAAGTYVYCTDCHNNNNTRSGGGSQAAGVHGSAWPHILERRNDMEPPPAAPGSAAPGVSYMAGPSGTYALCYKCHDIDNSTLQNRSFKEHDKHVRGENAACSTCHDPHGINGGNPTNNGSLINFDLTIVGPSSSGQLFFQRTGTFQGLCYLRCHGEDHNPKSYGAS